MSAERRGKTVDKKCGMSKRDAVNDPPFFAFDQNAATDILKSAGSDFTTHKSAMEVSMPFRCMHLCGAQLQCAQITQTAVAGQRCIFEDLHGERRRQGTARHISEAV